MSRQPYGMTTPEQRDQAADDHDEAACHRAEALAEPAPALRPAPQSTGTPRHTSGWAGEAL